MTFKCMVSYNGVLYPAGANVPAGNTEEQTKVEEQETVVEKPVRKTTRKKKTE